MPLRIYSAEASLVTVPKASAASTALINLDNGPGVQRWADKDSLL